MLDHIECPQCHKKGTPNLWHFRPFLLGKLRYMKTQHICRFCGVSMYETGGKINPLGWIALFFVGYLLFVLFVQTVLPNLELDFGKIRRSAIGTVSLGLIVYGIYKVIKRFR